MNCIIHDSDYRCCFGLGVANHLNHGDLVRLRLKLPLLLRLTRPWKEGLSNFKADRMWQSWRCVTPVGLEVPTGATSAAFLFVCCGRDAACSNLNMPQQAFEQWSGYGSRTVTKRMFG